MGSVFAYAGFASPFDPETIARAQLRLSSHRGSDVDYLMRGQALVGVVSGDGVWSESLDADSRFAIALSGEIDNLGALSKRLFRGGISLGPEPGAGEVVLHALDQFGFEILRDFRGVFVGVVTDGKHLWAFRDHVGFRPLFFHRDRTCAAVGMEPKQVVAASGIPYEPNLPLVEQTFFGRVGDESETPIVGVERVPARSILELSAAGSSVTRYWHPDTYLESADIRFAEVSGRFDELMGQAVRRVLTPGTALSLSGGVDSCTIAAFAGPPFFEVFAQPLPAVSALYPRFPSVDEHQYVKEVADRLDLVLHTYEARAHPMDDMTRWVDLLDSPLPVVSLSETFEHLRVARELGFAATINGELAETVFDMRSHVLAHLLSRGRIRAAAQMARRFRERGTHWRFLSRQAVASFVPQFAGAGLRAAFPRRRPTTIPSWLDPTRVPLRPFRAARHRWADAQMIAFRGPGLAFEADDLVQSVAQVAIRRPWADIDVWEFFLSLPAEIKFPDPTSKSLVRTLMRGRVPDVVLDRTDKTVFDAYIQEGIDYDELGKWLLDPVVHISGVDYGAVAEALQGRKLDLGSFMWAKDLAAVHAFLSRW